MFLAGRSQVRVLVLTPPPASRWGRFTPPKHTRGPLAPSRSVPWALLTPRTSRQPTVTSGPRACGTVLNKGPDPGGNSKGLCPVSHPNGNLVVGAGVPFCRDNS